MRALTLKEEWDKLSDEKKWEEYLRVVANLDDQISNTAEANPEGWECGEKLTTIHTNKHTHL